jgi:hypothetical protein
VLSVLLSLGGCVKGGTDENSSNGSANNVAIDDDSFSEKEEPYHHLVLVGVEELRLLRLRQLTTSRAHDKEIKDYLKALCFASPRALKIIDETAVEDLFALEYVWDAYGVAGCGSLTTRDRDNTVVWGKALDPLRHLVWDSDAAMPLPPH